MTAPATGAAVATAPPVDFALADPLVVLLPLTLDPLIDPAVPVLIPVVPVDATDLDPEPDPEPAAAVI